MENDQRLSLLGKKSLDKVEILVLFFTFILAPCFDYAFYRTKKVDGRIK